MIRCLPWHLVNKKAGNLWFQAPPKIPRSWCAPKTRRVALEINLRTSELSPNRRTLEGVGCWESVVFCWWALTFQHTHGNTRCPFKEIPGKKPIQIGARYPRDDKWAKVAHALQDHEHEWYDTRTRYDWRSWPQRRAGWSSRGGWRLKILLVTANGLIFHTRKHRSLEEVNKTSFWKQHGTVSWHTY